jgi:hypothetical protein
MKPGHEAKRRDWLCKPNNSDGTIWMVGRLPFCDLERALTPLRGEIEGTLRRVLDRGWFLRGPET